MRLYNYAVFVILQSAIGTLALAYLQDAATQALLWFCPCLAIILADLAAGVTAARRRGETVRFSSAARRTANKTVCYLAWVCACVALNKAYGTGWLAPAGMGVVFLVEGLSFISNILEPHGYRINIRALLGIIGKRHNIDGLGEAIEKQDNNG